MEVRTRFAPSPTGFMHLGGVRTALYNYLYAKKNHGKFILRIEDTDQERYVEGATDVIYDTLRACGMEWDEGPDKGGDYGPYVQSERKPLYLPYAKQLIEKGAAYYCFCTKEELDERRAAAEARGEVFKYDKHCLNLSKEEVQAKLDAGTPYVIRMNCPTTGESTYDDEVFGHLTFPNDTLDDMVLIKTDGMPTYNFANVIDDHLMGITHVMRGMEYLSSTPKYNMLYNALDPLDDSVLYLDVFIVIASAVLLIMRGYGMTDWYFMGHDLFFVVLALRSVLLLRKAYKDCRLSMLAFPVVLVGLYYVATHITGFYGIELALDLASRLLG